MKYKYAILLLILIISCDPSGSKYIISPGDRIHHDDFEYLVQNYVITRFIRNGSDTLHSRGIFYLVKFKVENMARRVDHTWNNNIGFIIDERGTTYENIDSVQQYFEKAKPFGLKNSYTTEPGTSDSTYLAFDLPFNVTKPFLKVRGNTLMGDVFDGGKFRKVRVRLF